MTIFSYHPCIRRPRYGRPCRNIATPFGTEKLEWCDGKKYEDMITRFRTIHERDGRTDRQTPHDGIDRAYVKHRAAKNNMYVFRACTGWFKN